MDDRPSRGRLEDAGRGPGRPGNPADAAAFLGRVYDAGAIPDAVLRYYAVRPIAPTGDEAEGAAAGSSGSASGSARVLVLGPKAPRAGDDLVCHKIGDRWVAQRGQVAPPNALVATVFGCFGLRLPGATVACTQTGQSATTDDQGIARIAIGAAGTYSGTISRDRFVTQPWSLSIAGTGAVSMARTLAVASGFHCFCNCPIPLPSTLLLDDPVYGPIALVYTGSVRTWTAARLSTPRPGRLMDPPPGGAWFEGCTVDADVQVPIVYQVACEQGLYPRVNVLFSECQKIFPHADLPTLTDGPLGVDFAGWPLSPSGASGAALDGYRCSPLDYSAVVTFANNGTLLYPGGPHTFRVREP